MDDINFDRKLGPEKRNQLRQRRERYREEIEEQGFELHVAKGKQGQFMALIVIDPETDRKGFLGPGGTIQWLDELGQAGVGSLAQFVVSSIQSEIDEKLGPV